MNNLKNQAEKLYEEELIKIESLIGSGVTFSDELAKLSKKLFGDKFKGVFASDELNKLKSVEEGYFIFNLDKSDEPGSHWIGIVKTNKGILVYDSFGRGSKEIIPGIHLLGNRVKDTEDDAEQKVFEDNWGARVLSFLKIFDEYGSEIASLI